MKQRLCLIVAAVILSSVGCKDSPFEASPGSLSEHRMRAGSSDISVMTQNLYVGADIDLVIQALGTANPDDDFPALLFAIETLDKTAFPARVEAIADKIARARPHAVGLQEVSQINIDLRPLGMPVAVSQDFLAMVQSALARRGLHYTVAATSTNITVSLVSGLVRLTDQDALLIDADRVRITAASGQNFAVNLGPVAPGISLMP